MKRINKITALLLVLLMIPAFSFCKKTERDSTAKTGVTTETESVTSPGAESEGTESGTQTEGTDLPETPDVSYDPGDVVLFGSYEQDNNLSSGTEPIEWIVLEVRGNAYLLISRYGLDSVPYNDKNEAVSYENSYLCRWLNGVFSRTAFSENEQADLIRPDEADAGGRVFCLSVSEAEKYFPGAYAKKTDATIYAQAKGAYTEAGVCGWWLRGGITASADAPRINIEGNILTDNSSGTGLCRIDYSVRPVVLVRCGSDHLSLKPTSGTSSDDASPVYDEPAIHAYSPYIMMINADTGECICRREPFKEVPPASLTKIMTAVVALENIPDLNAEFTFTPDIIQYLKDEDSSVAGFSSGETVTAKDLLYAAMLPSGGDGAIGLAVLAAGSIDGFVDLMNQKVSELGLGHTHFANPTGLDAPGQYSCAYDMCLIMRYAVGNEDFVQVISTMDYTTAPTSYHPNGIRLRCLIKEGLTDNNIRADYLIGGKSGYTETAKLCLATYSRHNCADYILVTLGAGSGSKKPQYQFFDMDALCSFYFYGTTG